MGLVAWFHIAPRVVALQIHKKRSSCGREAAAGMLACLAGNGSSLVGMAACAVQAPRAPVLQRQHTNGRSPQPCVPKTLRVGVLSCCLA